MFISLIKTFQLFILSIWLQIYKRKQPHIVAKEAIWRPFCLCKLDGQELRISLGNRVYQIQHTQIRLKSLVPCFYPQMPLTFTFSRNPTRLLYYSCQNQVFQATFSEYISQESHLPITFNSHINVSALNSQRRTSSLLTLSVQGIL